MGEVIIGYIGTFSESFNVAVLVWPLLSLLLSVPVLVALYRRDGWLPLTTVFAVYASILYAAGLVCFTLYPLPTGDAGPGITYGVPPILDPLNFVRDIAEGGVRAVFQLLFNIVLFVPLGFIARTLLKLKLPLMLALSFAATCLIETAQFTGLSGAYPFAYRTFDVDDLICNTLGSLIGWGLAHLAVRLTQREAEVQPPATHNPGFVRRAVALWTDVMMIHLCAVVPRLMVAAGLRLMTGDAFDEALLALVNGEMWIACYLVAFAVVELVVPWMRDGSTPAGLFYRMSCETRKRAGAARVVFYAERAVVLLLVVAHPLCAGCPGRVLLLRSRDALRPRSQGVGREGRRWGRGVRDTGSLSGVTRTPSRQGRPQWLDVFTDSASSTQPVVPLPPPLFCGRCAVGRSRACCGRGGRRRARLLGIRP